MPSINGRMTDLFIPVGRPQSSTSTTKSDSSVDTATVSALSKSTTTSPSTTVSDKISARNSRSEPIKPGSRITTRYTIPGPPPAAERFCSQSVTHNSQPQPKQPDAVNDDQQSQSFTSHPSSVGELMSHVSKTTARVANKQTLSPSSSTTHSPLSTKIRPMNGQPQGSASPTPAIHRSVGRENVDPTKVILSPMRSSKGRTAMSIETYPPDLAPGPPFRSHSQSSSRSNRSCPPASFPPGFYDKDNDQPFAIPSPSRSKAIRAMEVEASIRSRSSLKFELSSQQAVSSIQPILERPNHRRHQSDSTFTIKSKRVSIPTKGEMDLVRASFHNTIHYYMACPHASPPCTRPLDTTPKLDKSCQPPRSIIEGSCFDCDTIRRRDSEATILVSFNPRITSHLSDLYIIISQMEFESPILSEPPTTPTPPTQRLTLDDGSDYIRSESTFKKADDQESLAGSSTSVMSEDDVHIPISIRMQVLQERIAELTFQRDKEVRDLWRGYSQRWGPGTVGLFKNTEIQSIPGTPDTPGSRSSMRSGRSNYTPSEGRMKLDWIRDQRHLLD